MDGREGCGVTKLRRAGGMPTLRKRRVGSIVALVDDEPVASKIKPRHVVLPSQSITKQEPFTQFSSVA